MFKKVISKKLFSTLAAALALTLTLSAAPTSCKKSSAELTPVQIEKVQKECGVFTIEVSPKVELLFIAGRLAGFDQLTKGNYSNSDYMLAADSFFGKHKDHEFIKLLKAYSKKSKMNIFAINTIMPYIDETMSSFICPEEEMTCLDKRWAKLNKQKFLQAFNAFAVDSKFDKFCILNKSTFITYTTSLQNVLASGNTEDWLKDFYQDPADHKIIIHTSMSTNNIYDHQILPATGAGASAGSGGTSATSAAPNAPARYLYLLPPSDNPKYEIYKASQLSSCYVWAALDSLWEEKKDTYISQVKKYYDKKGMDYKKVTEEDFKYNLSGTLTRLNTLDFALKYLVDKDTGSEDDFTKDEFIEGLKAEIPEDIWDKFFPTFSGYCNEKSKYPTYNSFAAIEIDMIIEYYEYLCTL